MFLCAVTIFSLLRKVVGMMNGHFMAAIALSSLLYVHLQIGVSKQALPPHLAPPLKIPALFTCRVIEDMDGQEDG